MEVAVPYEYYYKFTLDAILVSYPTVKITNWALPSFTVSDYCLGMYLSPPVIELYTDANQIVSLTSSPDPLSITKRARTAESIFLYYN